MLRLMCLAILGAALAVAQPVPTQVQTFPDQYVRQDPGRCVEGQTLYNLTEHASKRCDSTGTWVAGGGGGSGTVNSGAFPQLGYYAATGTAISPTGPSMVFNPNVIGPPAAPSLAKVGAGTGTLLGYRLVCGLLGASPVALGTAPTDEATVSGNATLDGAHSINVTAPDLSGTGLTSCDVYRTTAGGTPNTVGLIGNVASGGTLSDIGLAIIAPFSFLPSDYSQGTATSLPYVNTSSGSAFGCQAFANNATFFPFQDAASGLAVLSKSSCGVDAAFMVHVQFDANGGSSNGAQVELEVPDDGVTKNGNVQVLLGQTYSFGHTTGSLSSVYGTVGYVGANAVSDGVINVFYGSAAAANGATINGDIRIFYVNGFNGGTINGKFIGYFNENVTQWAGLGKAFSWYSEGGAGHFETGDDATVGVEIERHSGSQSADLFRLLDSDGTTILSRFDKDGIIRAAGYKSSDGTTGVTVSACTLFKEGLCVAGT